MKLQEIKLNRVPAGTSGSFFCCCCCCSYSTVGWTKSDFGKPEWVWGRQDSPQRWQLMYHQWRWICGRWTTAANCEQQFEAGVKTVNQQFVKRAVSSLTPATKNRFIVFSKCKIRVEILLVFIPKFSKRQIQLHFLKSKMTFTHYEDEICNLKWLNRSWLRSCEEESAVQTGSHMQTFPSAPLNASPTGEAVCMLIHSSTNTDLLLQ